MSLEHRACAGILRRWLLLLSICMQPCVPLHSRLSTMNNSLHPQSRVLMSSNTVQEATPNDITEKDRNVITVPRFFPRDIPEGTYPSALHLIHVQSCLTPNEAATCLSLANDYASVTGRFEEPDTTRHETYSTCDFAIEDCEALENYLNEIGFHNRIYQQLSDAHGVDTKDMSYIDCFCANYRARNEKNTKTMDRLEAHRDGSLLSYTVLLTPPNQFEGGGTFFDALRDASGTKEEGESPLYPGGVVRPHNAGDCVLHSGKLLHGADVVTAGERTVLVGFVDVAEWCQRPSVMAEACREFGRMDCAAYRNRRQEKMTGGGQKGGWTLGNNRWLPKGNKGPGGKSHISGFVPAFDSVRTRADPEYQRQKKLEAEDVLLRSIMLPEEDRYKFSSFEGDISSFEEDITIL